MDSGPGRSSQSPASPRPAALGPVSQAPAPEAGPADTAEPGQPRIEGYQIVGFLGRGGMGSVWRATQLSTRREVALKVLGGAAFGSVQARRRFEREIELAARLNHPHIARVYDSGLYYGSYFYAMQLVEGPHLDEHVRQQHLDTTRILGLMARVARAVHHAHQQGIIHRDLKPANIRMTTDGEPCVLDFGLARPLEAPAPAAAVTLDGGLTGTLAYASPQQAAGALERPDIRDDVYSLGVILFQLLTGQLPHDVSGTTFEVQRRILEEEPRRPRALNPALSAELQSLLLTAIAREPAQRYQSAAALADDIDAWLQGEPLSCRPLTAAYFLRKRLRKHWRGVAVAALIGLALLGTAVYSYLRILQERDNARRHAAATSRALYLNRITLAKVQIERDDRAAALVTLDLCPEPMRGWEWRRLRYLADQSVLAIPAPRPLRDLAVLPDRRRIVALDAAASVVVWDGSDGRLLNNPAPPTTTAPAGPFALSADGRTAAVVDGRQLLLLDTAAGVQRRRLDIPLEQVAGVSLSPDGGRVAVTDRREAMVWDLSADAAPLRLACDDHVVRPLLGPEGALALLGDSSLQCWDARTGTSRWRIPWPNRSGRAVWSADGQRLAVAAREGVRIMDAADGRTVAEVAASAAAADLDLDPTGRLLAAAFPDGRIIVQDPAAPQPAALFHGPTGVQHIVFHPDGRRVVTAGADRVIRIWDLRQTAEGVERWPDPDRISAESLVVAPDGAMILEADGSGPPCFWDAATGRPERLNAAPGNVIAAALSPDGRQFADGDVDGAVRVWDAAARRELRLLAPASGQGCAVAWQPQGGRVAAAFGGPDPRVCVWDAATGRQELVVPRATALAFSGDGRRMAAATEEGAALTVYAVGSWTPVAGAALKSGQATALAWSPDSRRIAVRDSGGSVTLYDPDDLRSHRSFRPFGAGQTYAVVFDPSGRRLLTLGTSAKLWDVETTSEVLELSAPDLSRFSAAVFAPDGRLYLGARTRRATALLTVWHVSAEPPPSPAPAATPP